MPLEDLLVYAAMQRMVERAIVFIFVTGLCVVLVIAYRKAVQRLDFNVAADKVGAGGTFIMAMPVFLLLVMVGFGFIVFSQPISVRSLAGVELPDVNADQPSGPAQPARTDTSIRFSGPLPEGSLLTPEQVIASLGIVQEHIADGSPDDTGATNRARSALRILEAHMGDIIDAHYGDGSFALYSEIKGQLVNPETRIAELNITADEENLYLKIDGLFSGADLDGGN